MENLLKLRFVSVLNIFVNLVFVFGSYYLIPDHQDKMIIVLLDPFVILLGAFIFYLLGIHQQSLDTDMRVTVFSSFVAIVLINLFVPLYYDYIAGQRLSWLAVYGVSSLQFASILGYQAVNRYFIRKYHRGRQGFIVTKEDTDPSFTGYRKLQGVLEIENVVQNYVNQGKEVAVLAEIYEILVLNAHVKQVNGKLLFILHQPYLSYGEVLLKRISDLVLGLIMLILVGPLMFVCYAAIPLTSKGPAIYKQERTGYFGKTFNMYKFRTMVSDAEKETGPVFAMENDSRITKLGRFLRATRIDELPQIINVIKGEMSIVGPRPERPIFVEQYEKEIAGYKLRFIVKPGITGLAQIQGRYDSTAKEKLGFDLLYIQNYSLMMDLKILARTVYTILHTEPASGYKKSPTERTASGDKKIWEADITAVTNLRKSG